MGTSSKARRQAARKIARENNPKRVRTAAFKRRHRAKIKASKRGRERAALHTAKLEAEKKSIGDPITEPAPEQTP